MSLNIVGKSLIRVDAKSKVTGRAQYPDDLQMDNCLYGATLRSEIPHGEFDLDLKEAKKTKGIIRIFTHLDLVDNSYGVVFKDHQVLVRDKVRSIGDPLAFVVGETREACKEALEKILVNYKELPGVFDPIEAMTEESPKVHGDSNILYHYKIRKGNLDLGKKKSAYIAKNTYKTQMVDHGFIQPEAGLAYIGDDGKLTLATATQYPHYDREEISRALGLNEEDVRVINTNIGGAFGGREDISMQIHLALAAWTLKRPVRILYSREESFISHSKRHPLIMEYETGASKDGIIQYLEARIIGDTGAYASWATNVLRKAGVHATGPYRVENVKVDSYAVYTNNPFAGAMRGFGAAQPPVGIEQQMDILGELTGLGPIEIRRRNIFKKGDTTATGQVLNNSVPLDICLEEVAKKYFEYKSIGREGLWKK